MPLAFATNLDRFNEIKSLAREDMEPVKVRATTDQVFVGYGLTAMMAVAYVAGEPLSNRPRCTAPFLAAFAQTWGDSLRRAEREALLLPFIPALVDARGGGERYLPSMALDWLVRESLPLWLRAVGRARRRELLDVVPSPSDPEAAERMSSEFETLASGLWVDLRSKKAGISQLLPSDPYRPRNGVRPGRDLPGGAEFAAFAAIGSAYGPASPLPKLAGKVQHVAELCGSVRFFASAYDSIRASTRGAKDLSRDEIVERAQREGDEAVRTIGLRAQGSALALLRRMIDRV